MGLLDNLFKSKPEPDAQKEQGVELSENSEVSEPSHAGPVANTKAAFLSPKHYIPRSSAQVVPPTRAQPPPERLQVLAPTAPPTPAPVPVPERGEIVLMLGDVLSRIPTHFLRQGEHDGRRELRFPAGPLAADIARGRAAVSLHDIAAQCPDVFVSNIGSLEGIPIRLPLQKLVEQISIDAQPRPAAHGLATESPPIADPPGTATSIVEPPPPILPSAPPVSAPPSPAPSAGTDATGEDEIHLSLAAILTRCPPEIILRPLPSIDESVRVTFPFAPIERQLATGSVEVSSLRFISALPLELMKYFEAKPSVKVPLPLEEIFQNLPNPESARNASAEIPVAAARSNDPPPPPVVPQPVVIDARATEPAAPLPAVVPPVAATPEREVVAPVASQPAVEAIELQKPAAPAAAVEPVSTTPPPPPASEPATVRAFVPTIRPPVILHPGTPPIAASVPPPPSEPAIDPPPPAVARSADPVPPEPAPIPASKPEPEQELPPPAPAPQAGLPQIRPRFVPPPVILGPVPTASVAQPVVVPEQRSNGSLSDLPPPPPPAQPPPAPVPAAPSAPRAPALDLARICAQLVALPGIQACILTTAHDAAHRGELPPGLDAQSVRELGRGFRSLHAERSAGAIEHFTLHGERCSLSFFTRGEACVCAVQRARVFLPGVREEFAAAAEQLAAEPV